MEVSERAKVAKPVLNVLNPVLVEELNEATAVVRPDATLTKFVLNDETVRDTIEILLVVEVLKEAIAL